MKKLFYITAAATVMGIAAIPVFAETVIKPSGSSEDKGILFDIVGKSLEDVTKFTLKTEDGEWEVELIPPEEYKQLNNWEGATQFKSKIIIEKVVGDDEEAADAGNVTFTLNETSYNLFRNYVTEENVLDDEFAQVICKEVGLDLSISDNGDISDKNNNPRYETEYDPVSGELILKDKVNQASGEIPDKMIINDKKTEVTADGNYSYAGDDIFTIADTTDSVD